MLRHLAQWPGLGRVGLECLGIGPHEPVGRAAGSRGRAEALEYVDDVKVVEVVRLAVGIKRRALGIGTEPHGAALVGDPGERDLLAQHLPASDGRTPAPERTEQVLELSEDRGRHVLGVPARIGAHILLLARGGVGGPAR